MKKMLFSIRNKKFIVAIIAATFILSTISTFAMFEDRISKKVNFQIATFTKDGYALSREYNDIEYAADETVEVTLTESNDKTCNIQSVISLTAEWVSEDSENPFDNANAADNLSISIDEEAVDYTVKSANNISFTLPEHDMEALSTDNERVLKIHIPADFDASGHLDFKFTGVELHQINNLGDAGFNAELDADDLNADTALDFSVNIAKTDAAPPVLTLVAPPSTESVTYTVNGTVSDDVGVKSVVVNGVEADIEQNGNWSAEITLSGTTVTAVATDTAGNKTTEMVTYEEFTVNTGNRADIGYDENTDPYNDQFNLVIPATFYDEGKSTYYKVTEIANNTFYESGLGSLKLPDSLTTIGNEAFASNMNLHGDLVIPSSVTSLGTYAFYDTHFASVTIPGSVKTIPAGLFYMSSMQTLILGDGITEIGAEAFVNSNLVSLTIPASVETIANGAFGSCWNLTSITFNHKNNDPIEIAAGAFYLDDYLETTINTVNDSVLNYDWVADNRATAPDTTGPILTMTPPPSSESINFTVTGTVSDDSGVKSVKVNGIDATITGNTWSADITLTGTTVTAVATDTLGYETTETVTYENYTISSSNRSDLGFTDDETDNFVIPATFYNNSKGVWQKVTSIGNGAFDSCYSLTSVSIPDSVTQIGNDAFNCCGSLTDVTIPNSVISIGDSAFYDSGLKVLTIPDSVTSIGYCAFYGCHLSSITIPNNVTYIDEEAFAFNSSLTNITFDHTNEDSITIGTNAFYVAPYTETTITTTNDYILNTYDWVGDNRDKD